VDVTDAQIGSALGSARGLLLDIFGLTVYDQVRTYDGEDPALLEKQERFLHAEASFALSFLPRLLNSQQLMATGLVARKKTGESEVVFATLEDIAKMRRVWEEKAYTWLKPYLTLILKDAEGDAAAFRSASKRMTLAAI
jgi:hypothetical protein